MSTFIYISALNNRLARGYRARGGQLRRSAVGLPSVSLSHRCPITLIIARRTVRWNQRGFVPPGGARRRLRPARGPPRRGLARRFRADVRPPLQQCNTGAQLSIMLKFEAYRIFARRLRADVRGRPSTFVRSEKDTKLAQKLAQLQPFIVVFHRNAWANFHLLGQPDTFLALQVRGVGAGGGDPLPLPALAPALHGHPHQVRGLQRYNSITPACSYRLC